MATTLEKKLKKVRFTWPEDVHTIIKKHQAKMITDGSLKGAFPTFEEACIDFIRKSKF